MKTDGLKKWWAGMTSQQKAIAVAIICLLLFIMYRQAKGAIEGFGTKVQSKSTLTVLQSQGIKPSYGSDTYARFADRMEIAMKGAGTDEDIIYKVYSYLHNDADMVKLNQAFGIRNESTLREWLLGDLDASEIAKINELLRDKGITRLIK